MMASLAEVTQRARLGQFVTCVQYRHPSYLAKIAACIDARVDIFPDEENPGYYAARFYLRPHYQLEAMDIGLSLVSRLPEIPK